MSLHPLFSPKLGQDQSMLCSRIITAKILPLVLMAYRTLRWVFILHLGAWICTPNILALPTACKPIVKLNMCLESLANAGYTSHALDSLNQVRANFYHYRDKSLLISIWKFFELILHMANKNELNITFIIYRVEQ